MPSATLPAIQALSSVPVVAITAAPSADDDDDDDGPNKYIPFVVFGVIALVTLLVFVLYLLIISRRRARARAAPSEAEQAARDAEGLRRLEEAVPSGVLRLDDKGQIPSLEGRSEVVCIICLEKLAEGTPARHLPCRHVFHTLCIDGWFRARRYTCPICIAPYFVSP